MLLHAWVCCSPTHRFFIAMSSSRLCLRVLSSQVSSFLS